MMATETSGSSEAPLPPAELGPARPGRRVRRCSWCHPGDLYRVDRRIYEWAFQLLWLHPYVCCRCGTRGLMIGRSFARNWRWRRVRIRIIFRASLIGTYGQRLIRVAPPRSRG
jgi:hypothetical protein